MGLLVSLLILKKDFVGLIVMLIVNKMVRFDLFKCLIPFVKMKIICYFLIPFLVSNSYYNL